MSRFRRTAPRLKILLISCMAVAVLGITALASASAAAAAESAPHWKVSEEFLGEGVSKEIGGATTEPAILESAEIMFESPSGDCSTTGQIVGSPAEKPGTVTGASLTCTHVGVVEGGACTVHSTNTLTPGEVITNELKGKLVWLNSTGDAAGVLFEPTAGSSSPYVEIKVEGCGLAGTYPVTGQIIGKALPVGEEVVAGTLSFPATTVLNWWNNATTRVQQAISRLKLKALNAKFEASLHLELKLKSKFGVFPD